MWLTVAVLNSGEILNIRKGKLHLFLSVKGTPYVDFGTQFTTKRKAVRSGKTGIFRLINLVDITLTISGSKEADLYSPLLPKQWMKITFSEDRITVFRFADDEGESKEESKEEGKEEGKGEEKEESKGEETDEKTGSEKGKEEEIEVGEIAGEEEVGSTQQVVAMSTSFA